MNLREFIEQMERFETQLGSDAKVFIAHSVLGLNEVGNWNMTIDKQMWAVIIGNRD